MNQNRRTPLGREGYPITTAPDKMFPFPIPPISVAFRGSDIPRPIKDFTEVKEMPSKDKTIRTYTVRYKPGLLGILRASKYERGQFPMANTIGIEDLENLIVIIRIISGFLHVHKYPAFTTNEDFEHEFETRIEEKKRTLKTTEYEQSIDENAKKRFIEIEEDGEKTWVKPINDAKGSSVRLSYAKPPEISSHKEWGSTSDIPTTDGIVFPFEEDLAIWDKETVCTLIGLYFVRCLGHTTDGCLIKYSELCTSWKRSLHRTSLGDILSHLCRVIEIGIPAQARVFPVLESGRYTGCYLSGSGYSVALRGDVFRPTSYDNNKEDFGCFEGNEAILEKIARVNSTEPEKAVQKMKTFKGDKSMRGLQKYLDSWVQTPQKYDQIRHLAARLHYPQEFLRINMENIRLVLSWIKGTPIPVEAPMHAYGLGRTSTYELALSAFGPNAPSPLIPGAPKIQLSEKMPSSFNKTLAFRTTLLENAIGDWKEVGLKGFTYNGPERLSARYQYVQVKGDADRKGWFEAMYGFHIWFKDIGAKMSGEVVTNDDEEGSGGISLGDVSIQFDGF